MFFLNQNVDANPVDKFLSVDTSFPQWFSQSNDLDESKINTLYNAAYDGLKTAYANAKTKEQKSEISSLIEKIKKDKKSKISELKKADKQILAFKKFRYTFKACSEAIDLANTQVNNTDILEINKNFLEKYRSILTARHSNGKINYDNYTESNLNRNTKELLNETKKVLKDSRKGKKTENFLKTSEVWYRQLLSAFGIKSKQKARTSKSAKFDLVGENDLSTWMEKHIKDSAKLADIIIPCSHDSGAYSITPISNTDVFSKAAQTHTVNFRGQLRAGIRYFDLRMNLENGIPVMAHDMVNGAPVSEALRQVVKFAKSHPKEVIIIEISHTSDECLDVFYKLPIVKEIQDIKYSLRSKKIGDVTLGEIRNSGKNVLMFEDNDGHIIDVYDEKERESRDYDVILKNEIDNLVDNWNKNKRLRKLHKITPTHCANIKDFFSKGKYWKPLWNAVEQSSYCYDKLLESKEFKDFANVVSYDDALGSAWFAKQLIQLNKERMENLKS